MLRDQQRTGMVAAAVLLAVLLTGCGEAERTEERLPVQPPAAVPPIAEPHVVPIEIGPQDEAAESKPREIPVCELGVPDLFAVGADVLSVTDPSAKTEAEAGLRAVVMALDPLGYWPMDEGTGDLLIDVARDNHARAFNLEWQNGLLDFTSGFHWIEIPYQGAYRQATSLSIGGWFFTRRDDYLGGTDVDGPERNQDGPHHAQGVSLINNAYGHRGGWVRWDGLQNVQDGIGIRLRAPGKGRYGSGSLLDVVQGNRGDILDTAHRRISLPKNEWQHVLFTFENGTARLFVNGKPVAEKSGVTYTPAGKPFVIGNDIAWWMLYPVGSQSLHGSVRDVVLFDRALSSDEVATLAAKTRPSIHPEPIGENDVVVEWKPYRPDAAASLDATKLFAVLKQMEGESPERIQALMGSWRPVVESALEHWQTRALAARLLLKADGEAARAKLAEQRMSGWIRQVGDAALSSEERAGSALALAELGEEAAQAVPALSDALEDLLEQEGIHVPRVEDLLRNSLIQALFNIAPQNESVRQLLGRAFAAPLLNLSDLSAEWAAEVVAMAGPGRAMDALEVYRELPLQEHGATFFTQGDAYRDSRENLSPNQRAYAPVVISEGIRYQVGSGIPWRSGEKITPAEYRNIIGQLPAEHREAARNWEFADSSLLFRVLIHKIMPDGTRETGLLEGPWFVFEGNDEKMQGWTIDIDSEGYLHLTGGMHNRPIPRFYAPGVWEKMGLERSGDNAPTMMYWVSKRPHDVTEFEFVGHRDNPRNLPVAGMNYMNFIRDRENHMTLYGRMSAQGIQSWGMFRYDPADRRWLPVGGDARAIVESARQAHGDLFIQRGGSAWQPQPFKPEETVFGWAWQPHFYNFIRGWGARYDQTGRLHVRMLLHALAADSRIVDRFFYAWSDDLGQTWHRADGSEVLLPLTINPAPEHNADYMKGLARLYWELWLSLLNEAGYSMEDTDPYKF